MPPAGMVPAIRDKKRCGAQKKTNLEGGEMKATVYVSGLFGVRKIECHLEDHGRRRFAQYAEAPYVRYTEKGKRKTTGFTCSSNRHAYLIIVEGWNNPNPDKGTIETPYGFKTKYSSCDPRYEQEFSELIDKHILDKSVKVIADYRSPNVTAN